MDDLMTPGQIAQLATVIGRVAGLTSAICFLTPAEANDKMIRLSRDMDPKTHREGRNVLKLALTECLNTIREFEERE